jgi:cell wall assembly regulator SMI1
METANELVKACGAGDGEKVKELIGAGVSVNEPQSAPGGDPHFPLTFAARYGGKKIVQMLIDAGADVNVVRPKSKRSALLEAAKQGHADIVKVLLDSGADPNLCSTESHTALTEAVEDRTKSRFEIVRALLIRGADPNHQSKFATVLMMASASSSPEVVKALIAAGAEVNVAMSERSALIDAINGNRPENVAVLMEAGADPNQQIAGRTAIEYAKAKKAKKILPLLEGVKPTSKADQKVTTQPTIADSWRKIEVWLAANEPQLMSSLNPGATDAQILEVEKAIGNSLPEQIKESYRIHNGQSSGDLIPSPQPDADESSYVLYSTVEMLREWRSWKELADSGEFSGMESGPDQGIKNSWWHPGWISFASNGGGDSMCIDLAPAQGGTVGQIITMNHESSTRQKLANSFAEWLSELADTIESGVLKGKC